MASLCSKMTPNTQLMIVILVLLCIGVVEYVVSVAENYIIAHKSQDDELIYQYSGNIMNIFMQVFTFVNTVFVTSMSFKDAKPSEEGKRKNISKIFHFGVAFGLVSGLLVMFCLLFLRVELFSLFQQREYAEGATEYFNLTAPIMPLTYAMNVLVAVFMGLVLLKELIVITILTNTFYLVMLITLLKTVDDTIRAIGIANALYICFSFSSYIFVLQTKSFKEKYDILDFTYITNWNYRKIGDRKKLLNSDPEEKSGNCEEKSGSKQIKLMGKATSLLLTKNLAATIASVASTALLSSMLPKNQFIANNVATNTLQFTPFGSFFITLLTIFGPRFIAGGDKKSYKSIVWKAHANIVLAAVASLIAFFFFHTNKISLDGLTSPDNREAVAEILVPIWPIWMINLILTLYTSLYTTALVNFEKYAVLALTGILNSLGTLPIVLIFTLKYKSLLGLFLAPAIGNLIELIITAALFHFNIFHNDPKWKQKDQQLVSITIW